LFAFFSSSGQPRLTCSFRFVLAAPLFDLLLVPFAFRSTDSLLSGAELFETLKIFYPIEHRAS
jgi:hypothetical protein